jgi:hypothetical protein
MDIKTKRLQTPWMVPNAHPTTSHNGYQVEGNNVIKNHFIKMGQGYGDKVFHNKCHWVTNIYLVDQVEIVMLLHKLVGQ